jgi:hypothetical protein
LKTLQLRFIWNTERLAIAVDQKLSDNVSFIPITEFLSWPQQSARDELEVLLKAKPWIPEHEMIPLLEKVSSVIDCWQEKNTETSITEIEEKFPDCTFLATYRK